LKERNLKVYESPGPKLNIPKDRAPGQMAGDPWIQCRGSRQGVL